MGKGVIIACDFKNKEDTLRFLDLFQNEKLFLKIGMELFYSEGKSIIDEIKKRGHKIFLDLKLHDIPNTVNKAMKVLSHLNIDMVNVHASGGVNMMKAAFDGLKKDDGSSPLLIAVTLLTSLNQEIIDKELLIKEPLNDTIKHYALNAKSAGLNGVVCSPLEVNLIHQTCGKDFIIVTPGIRFNDSSKGDQKRVTTPKMAKELGSDYIVVGRIITEASNPVEVYHRCLNDFIG